MGFEHERRHRGHRPSEEEQDELVKAWRANSETEKRYREANEPDSRGWGLPVGTRSVEPEPVVPAPAKRSKWDTTLDWIKVGLSVVGLFRR